MSEEYRDEEEIIMELKNKIVFLEIDKENLKNELDKKDKVIEEMARALNYEYSICEPCPIENKVLCSFSGKKSTCTDCIKEYFYKKVEEEK